MSSGNKVTEAYDAVVSLPFCNLGLKFETGQLVLSEYLKPDVRVFHSDCVEVEALAGQIQQYVNNSDFRFQIDLKTTGTKFQQKIWKILSDIPVGTVRTYGDIARQTASSAQAVGNACRANPIPLIIPCHRVVSVSGIGGFAGSTSGYLVDIKRQLLKHEGLEF